jgi:glycine cleavage system H lipoate-binding protein
MNGWICKMTIGDETQLEDLLDSEKYEELLGE